MFRNILLNKTETDTLHHTPYCLMEISILLSSPHQTIHHQVYLLVLYLYH